MTTLTTTVQVRAFAAARAALGWSQDDVPVPTGASVADVLDEIVRRRPESAAVLARCAVLLDGRRVTDRAGEPALAGTRLDLLPPFAGG